MREVEAKDLNRVFPNKSWIISSEFQNERAFWWMMNNLYLRREDVFGIINDTRTGAVRVYMYSPKLARKILLDKQQKRKRAAGRYKGQKVPRKSVHA